MTIPGGGPITASLLSAELGDGKPRRYSTGGRPTLLGISKRGNKAIRRLMVQCARAYLIWVHRKTGSLADWVKSMLTRRHPNVVACALALARTVWALAAKHSEFKESPTRACS